VNWADYKHHPNSGNSQRDDPELRQRNERESVETGRVEPTTSTCCICNETKDDSDFYVKDRSTGRRDTTCKRCRIIQQRERTLGVTDDDYWKMYRAQKGRCGICLRRLYSRRYKAFCVDHDHDTGEIRGLLCHNCNRALGMFRDDVEALQRAQAWVKGQSDPPSNRS
jgi:hypothetical protein